MDLRASVLPWLSLALATSCLPDLTEDKHDTGPAVETDTDADGDSDTDTDGDADADSDAD